MLHWGAFVQPLWSWKSNNYYIFWVSVCSLIHPACKAHASYYTVIYVLSACTKYSQIISQTTQEIMWEKLFNIKSVYWFSLQRLSVTFLFLRIIQQDIIIHVHRTSCKEPTMVVKVESKFNFFDKFSNNTEMSNRMKICPVGAELFHADR